ncbi:MAG TPA: DUF1559 domain-containing protein [Pirellulaceae bacterium]|nr:DUF1559 domain-containing protein [Pirellulaceae bacterium]
MMGIIELYFILPFFLGFGFGFPAATPPADEIPLMSQIAPEECLFFATWTGATTPDPSKSPTETWMAQPELQVFYDKLKQGLKRPELWGFNNKGDSMEDAALAFLVELLDLMTTQSCSIVLKNVEVEAGEYGDDYHFKGGFVMHLAASASILDEHLERLASLAATQGGMDVETVEILGRSFQALTYVNFSQNVRQVLWGIHDEFLWCANDTPVLERFLKNAQTPPPQWLQKIRERLPIERFGSLAYFNLPAVMEIVANEMDFEFAFFKDIVSVDQLRSIAVTGGLDQHGAVSRIWLETNGVADAAAEPKFGVGPIDLNDLARINRDTNFSLSVRIDPLQAYQWFMNLMRESGGDPDLERTLTEFESETGIKIQEEIIDQLDGFMQVYGNVNMLDPAGSFVFSFRTKGGMAFHDTYQNFVELVTKNAASSGGEVKEQTRAGKTIYTYKYPESTDEFMIMPFTFEPSWCFADDELAISFNRSTLSRHVRREPLPVDEQLGATLNVSQLFQNSLNMPKHPTAILTINLHEMLKTLHPTLMELLESGIVPGSALNLTREDIPSLEIMAKELLPNALGVYLTNDGVELVSRQTFPASSIGTTAGALLVAALPANLNSMATLKRTSAMNNIRQQALAMHSYHDAFGSLPAPYSIDEAGKPLLSWRVQLLPFLGYNELYDEFKLDEPWDSEHNFALIERMPSVYKSHSLLLEPGKTTFVVPVGPNTLFREPIAGPGAKRGIQLSDVISPTGFTLMIIEANESNAVYWTQPSDFSTDADIEERLRNVHGTTTLLAWADGSTSKVDVEGKAEILKKTFLIDGVVTAVERAQIR